MIDDSNIVLISYPSGGFGNFIFHALTEFASNTHKVANEFGFSADGNSHSTKKYTDVYYMDPDTYVLNNPDKSALSLVLCDNGINNDSYRKVRTTFPTARIVRLAITSPIRPVIYQTCIVKAKNKTVVEEVAEHVANNWDDSDDYAVRENITLLYHNWNYQWEVKVDKGITNITIESLINNPVETISKLIHILGGEVINPQGLIDLCYKWKSANENYFKVYYDWHRICEALDKNESIDISDITSIHDQGYINYCIERKYNVIIPVYDYRDWFSTTHDIIEMTKCLKSKI